MIWLRQKHKLGCASASLAMIAGISYDEAIALVHPGRKKRTRVCTTVSHMADVMMGLGMEVEIRYNPASDPNETRPQWFTLSQLTKSHERMIWLGDWLGRPVGPALLTVWMDPYIPWRHAVVWDGERILDPMIKESYPVESYFNNLVSAIVVK